MDSFLFLLLAFLVKICYLQEVQENTCEAREDNKQCSRSLDSMALIPGGDYFVGTDHPVFPSDGEGPKRLISVKSFLIDIHEVSNEEFTKFVKETGYETEAESFGTSFVLNSLIKDDRVRSQITQSVLGSPWWVPVNGSSWKNPEGAGSFISHRMDHPVAHVSWNDAVSFCSWKGKRLPTEFQWEVSCRGGLKDRLYSWGNNLTPNGKHYANTWQGQFPTNDTGKFF